MSLVGVVVLGSVVSYVLIRLVIGLFPPIWLFLRKTLMRKSRDWQSFGAWAVVTGASDGIGREMAKQFAGRGMNVLLIARNQERLNETKKEILSLKNYGGEVDTLVVDFSDKGLDYDGQIAPKLKSLSSKGDIGVLVNNVGMSYPTAHYFGELSEEVLDSLISVNLRSTFQMTRLVLPGMTERRRGAVVCVGSGASELPSEPLYAGYAAVKGAVEVFCRSLRVECLKSNILVQCHVPLLVTSKLSKIRKPSFTVPTAESYAKDAMAALDLGSFTDPSTLSPSLIHSMMLVAISFVPLNVWHPMRLHMTSLIRKRALKKQQQSASPSGTKTNNSKTKSS